MESVSTMKWYIVRAQSNREKSVSERIIKDAEKGDLIGKIGQVIVPTEKSFHLKNGKKVPNTKIIAINTMACFNLNFELLKSRYDPGDELSWLEKGVLL